MLQITNGEPEVIGVASSEGKGTTLAWRTILQVTGGKGGRPPKWNTLPSGSKLLLTEKAGKAFHFRLDPWPLDSLDGEA